jgi:hypothetical protein
VADLIRNARPIWIGTGGRFNPEWVAGLIRNLQAIAKRAKTAMTSFRKKMTKCGTVKELYKDLESD